MVIIRPPRQKTIQTLKTRAEFQRVRGGGRASLPSFILEGKTRSIDEIEGPPQQAVPRFGFTITKKIGNAVVRNRIRRRLRAALCEIGFQLAQPTMDYVLVARAPSVDQDFRSLIADLETAFKRVHAPSKPSDGQKSAKTTTKKANIPKV